MRQKLFIFLALIALVVVLIGLNAASYTQTETRPDDEFYPNRSTYHAGATGMRALYDLLAETGRKPVRWQESTAALLTNSKNKPRTFVVIGDLRREFTDQEVEQLMRWVSLGGKLVVIDRVPNQNLIPTTANWQISAESSAASAFGIDPADQQQMTRSINAAKPLQPTLFTRKIIAVQPSRFASSIKLQKFSTDQPVKTNGIAPKPTPVYNKGDYEDDEPPPVRNGRGNGIDSGQGAAGDANKSVSQTNTMIAPNNPPQDVIAAQTAPLVHVASKDKNLLADFPFGSGQIVFLSDPFIVSNAGINLVDNAQLALNVIASREGAIAFDEFHQGFGGNENRLLSYFAGTPVMAILAQIALLVGVILFTQSRRFARPLPANEPNRLSKLEYVSAMAELQQRTKAYDLAIENIYSDFRRRAAKSLGVDNFTTSRKDLAVLIGERAKLNAANVEDLMQKCEDIIHGEPTNKREVLEITTRLREIEEKLGLKRTRKQAFRK
jgi:hypothetical protein